MELVNLEQFFKENKQLLEEYLTASISELQAPSVIVDAMKYSLDAGGKRIRPLLLLATLQSFGKDETIGLPVAAAVEMIHTYSLIHDDLPCMDDDDYRRGKLTSHKVFGEAMAVLAGDALLTYSFQVITKLIKEYKIDPLTGMKLVEELAIAAGPEGMVGGQVADMEGEGKSLNLNDLIYIHEHKTGKLLEFSLVAGATLANASEEEIKKLRDVAYHIGLAFQIKDDILDIEGEQEKIGKRVGSDTANDKVTYPSLLTLEGAKDKLQEHINTAKELLSSLELKNDLLHQVCDLIGNRDH